MNPRCPVCGGNGKVLAFGMNSGEPVVMTCPECAGLAILPASADDPPKRPARVRR